MTAADIMNAKPVIATETDDLNEVVQGVRIAGVRRVPVMTQSGSVRNEQRQERRLRPADSRT
ncbi:MAG: hypothetical protein ABW106_00535 [Steroidobacteraceae bacterium]